MTGQPYEIDLTRTARRALAERLPLTWSSARRSSSMAPWQNPQRVGKELDRPFHGVYSARVMQEWRVLYVIDGTQHRVTIRDINQRRDSYRAH